MSLDDDIRRAEREGDTAKLATLRARAGIVAPVATKIDRMVAANLRHAQVIYHTTMRNADGSPLRARVSGQCKTWKREPARFSVPIKHGMRDSGYLTDVNARDWRLTEDAARRFCRECAGKGEVCLMASGVAVCIVCKGKGEITS